MVQELGLTPLLYPGLEEPPCPGQFIALMICFATFEESSSALLESLPTYKLPWVKYPSCGGFGSLANGFYLSKKKFVMKIQRKLCKFFQGACIILRIQGLTECHHCLDFVLFN